MADKLRWIEMLDVVREKYGAEAQADLDRVKPELDALFKNRSYVPAKGTKATDGKPTIKQCFDRMKSTAKTPIGAKALEELYEIGYAHYREVYNQQRGIVSKKTAASTKSEIGKSENIVFPETAGIDEACYEGAVTQVQVNRYERNPEARAKCIAHYGAFCHVCGMDFEKTYGKIGKGFIHVHHIKPISEIGEKYKVDPIKDLIPVCPNCHAMLHQKGNGEAFLPAELNRILEAQKKE